MKWLTSMPHLSGGSMIVGFAIMLAGALLFISRPAQEPQFPGTPRFVVERSLIMGAVVLTAIGFLLLEDHLSESSGHAWTRIGAFLYLFGGVLIVAAEAIRLSQGDQVYPMVVTYVVLAFLAQAAIGLGIVQSGSLPRLLGWVTIVWSLSWLVILPLATPADVYFPVLHHLMPLAIGIVLLFGE